MGLVVFQVVACISVYTFSLAKYWNMYYTDDQEIEMIIGGTAVFFFSVQLLAVLTNFMLLMRTISTKQLLEYKEHKARLWE
jgi:uncharacterized membrane protein